MSAQSPIHLLVRYWRCALHQGFNGPLGVRRLVGSKEPSGQQHREEDEYGAEEEGNAGELEGGALADKKAEDAGRNQWPNHPG